MNVKAKTGTIATQVLAPPQGADPVGIATEHHHHRVLKLRAVSEHHFVAGIVVATMQALDVDWLLWRSKAVFVTIRRPENTYCHLLKSVFDAVPNARLLGD